MKLATQIIAFSLATVVLMTIAASYFTIRSAHEEFAIQQRDIAQRVAAAMTPPLADAWRAEGTTGLQRVLGPGGPASYLGLQVRWVWFDAKALQGTRPHLPQARWPSPSDPPVSIITAGSGQRQIHTYVPIRLAPDRVGGLELTESLASLERQTQREIWIDLVAISILAVLFVGIAYGTGMQWIGRPLQALVAKTQRIGYGDFSTPLELNQYNELGVLANSINDMCDRLTEQQAALRAETAQRVAALEQLRHADRLKTVGRLSAGIAHEMGTPLNVVAGRAALIAAGKLSVEEVKSSAATIKGEADRITAIVRQLLDFARRRSPNRAVEDLHALASQTADLLRQLAEKHHVRIEIAPAAERVTAAVDRSQLQQVLTNIFVNAFHAMPEGGTVHVAVSTGSDPPSKHDGECRDARISITDEGTGIAPEDLEHIFEPFFTTKDVGQGTGLGLSIAYGIIQEHGGRIEVATASGRGTCFTIHLPAEGNL